MRKQSEYTDLVRSFLLANGQKDLTKNEAISIALSFALRLFGDEDWDEACKIIVAEREALQVARIL